MPRTFTIANDERLIELVNSATSRLVIVSPGLWKPVAEAVVARIHSPDCPAQLSLILDVDPEVCRLGFGDVESIDLLNAALKQKGSQLQRQDGVRIGLIISDEEILIYSPTPKLIEAGSDADEKPNAIHLSRDAGAALARACGAGDKDDSTGSDQEDDRVGSDYLEQHSEQEIGLDFVDTKRVEEVKEDLRENPPKQFDLARIERVFNYKLEYVSFAVEHFKLDTRTVPLNPVLLGLAEKDLQDRLRNTFRVFEKGAPFKFEVDDPETEGKTIVLTETLLSDWARAIRKDYFIPLGSDTYGNLILKRRKPDFIKSADALKAMMTTYAQKVKESIDTAVSKTREQLINALLPRIKKSPPVAWLKQSVDGTLPDEAVRKRLEDEIDHAFGKVEQSFNPSVTYVFKGVTYSTITADPNFRDRIKSYFGEQEAEKLFEEYDASRGTNPDSPDDDDPKNPNQPELF